MQTDRDRHLVGIDTGGTFTDFVLLEAGKLRHCKVLSTPADPSRAISEGLARLGLKDQTVRIVHGTTVGTNAVLEGKGAKVAFVTTRGFEDLLLLGRQERCAVYDLHQAETAPPVPAERCFGVSTRALASGHLLERATDAELETLSRRVRDSGAESVAVCLLFAFLCPQEERRIKSALAVALAKTPGQGTGDRPGISGQPGSGLLESGSSGSDLFISLASEVLPEIREYERSVATWLNASVGPLIGRYLGRLQERLPAASIAVMQSSGCTVAAGQAAAQAVRLLLSGPAGGIAAARLLGRVTGKRRLLTLDMGGTSTDVALLDGEISLTRDSRIGPWPLSVPSVDIHTIGAGGGSIARIDAGGMLLVGPESAGADPGPACYGQGGTLPTVTDANVVLGRIPADTLLGGYLPLDRRAAASALDRLASGLGSSRQAAALGVVRLANEHMARALRVISVERGHDPADYALLCFGGAGGLHACELAQLLGIPEIILPALAGVLSAHGMLASQPGRELLGAVLREVGSLDPEWLESGFAKLEQEAAQQLSAEGEAVRNLQFRRSVELRYAGQSTSLTLPYPGTAVERPASMTWLAEAFHAAHAEAAGHRLGCAVELVNLRLAARAPAPVVGLEALAGKAPGKPRLTLVAELGRPVPVYERASLGSGEQLAGPAIVVDTGATVWLAPGWTGILDAWGNLRLTLVPGQEAAADPVRRV